MYFCLKNILLKEKLESNILYEHKLDNKIRVNIGKSYINRKYIKHFLISLIILL